MDSRSISCDTTPTSRGTILIVEDEGVARRALALLLSHEGFEPIVADSGESALHALRGHPTPEVALVDLNLPGMNGAELIRRVQAHDRGQAPIVVLMSAASLDEIGNALADPLVPVIRKPLDFPSLMTLLSEQGLRH